MADATHLLDHVEVAAAGEAVGGAGEGEGGDDRAGAPGDRYGDAADAGLLLLLVGRPALGGDPVQPAVNVSRSVMVAGVRAARPVRRSTASAWSRGSAASSTLPTAVECGGTWRPTSANIRRVCGEEICAT